MVSQQLENASELLGVECVANAIEEYELGTNHADARTGEQVLVMQREEVVPIVLHVQPAGTGNHRIELKHIYQTHHVAFGDRAVLASAEQLPQCSGRNVRPFWKEQQLVETRMDDSAFAGRPHARGGSKERHLRFLHSDNQTPGS